MKVVVVIVEEVRVWLEKGKEKGRERRSDRDSSRERSRIGVGGINYDFGLVYVFYL